MNTPYNDQWLRARSPQPVHERDASRAAHPPQTLREVGPGAHEAAPSALPRPVRKRPPWIDRDT
jgi:hypothetical protein